MMDEQFDPVEDMLRLIEDLNPDLLNFYDRDGTKINLDRWLHLQSRENRDVYGTVKIDMTDSYLVKTLWTGISSDPVLPIDTFMTVLYHDPTRPHIDAVDRWDSEDMAVCGHSVHAKRIRWIDGARWKSSKFGWWLWEQRTKRDPDYLTVVRLLGE